MLGIFGGLSYFSRCKTTFLIYRKILIEVLRKAALLTEHSKLSPSSLNFHGGMSIAGWWSSFFSESCCHGVHPRIYTVDLMRLQTMLLFGSHWQRPPSFARITHRKEYNFCLVSALVSGVANQSVAHALIAFNYPALLCVAGAAISCATLCAPAQGYKPRLLTTLYGTTEIYFGSWTLSLPLDHLERKKAISVLNFTSRYSKQNFQTSPGKINVSKLWWHDASHIMIGFSLSMALLWFPFLLLTLIHNVQRVLGSRWCPWCLSLALLTACSVLLAVRGSPRAARGLSGAALYVWRVGDNGRALRGRKRCRPPAPAHAPHTKLLPARC